MRSPIDLLIDTEINKLEYLVKAVLISVVPAIFIAYVLYQLNPSTNAENVDLPLAAAIIQLVVIAPLIETLMMWPIITVIARWTKNRIALTALLSACLWAAFHAIFNLNWGLTIFWPFFVFSIIFCVWRAKSLKLALAMTAGTHALQNLLAVIYLSTA